MADLQHVKGLAEVNAALAGLVERQRRNITRAGVAAGGRVIVNEAKTEAVANVRGDAGPIIARAIVQKRVPEECTQDREVAVIAVRRGKRGDKGGRGAWFWSLFEFGTRGHGVHVQTKKVLAETSGGAGVFFGKEVVIPPMPAQPFMRPAFDAKWRDAVDAMRERWMIRIHDAARELAKRV